MRVNVARMIEKSEGVKTIAELADLLNEKGVNVCGWTLYRWQEEGIGFNKRKLVAAAVALEIRLRDILILECEL